MSKRLKDSIVRDSNPEGINQYTGGGGANHASAKAHASGSKADHHAAATAHEKASKEARKIYKAIREKDGLTHEALHHSAMADYHSAMKTAHLLGATAAHYAGKK